MAITIIDKKNTPHNQVRIQVEMNDGVVMFFKFPQGLTNVQLKDAARDAYAIIKEADRLERRSIRIANRIALKVQQQGIDTTAAQEVDTEGVV